VSCRSRSAPRSASPSPRFTRKKRLNSLVGPTLSPGWDASVSAADICTSTVSTGPSSEESREGPEGPVYAGERRSRLMGSTSPGWDERGQLQLRPSSHGATDNSRQTPRRAVSGASVPVRGDGCAAGRRHRVPWLGDRGAFATHEQLVEQLDGQRCYGTPVTGSERVIPVLRWWRAPRRALLG
jgi:hypothetical protein